MVGICTFDLNRRRKVFTLLFLALTFLLIPFLGKSSGINRTSFENAFSVSGQVSDADGPLSGVTVLEKGTTNGVSTDATGHYQITLENENATLVFSFVGYNTREIQVSGRTSINVTLESASEQLGDVVVTALGIKRDKKALGYSVGQVAGKDLTEVPHENVLSGIEGRIPGVTVSQTAGAGSSVSMVIRGATSLNGDNQPLFVVDGTPVTNSLSNVGGFGDRNQVDFGSPIADINPEDIESIDILKGPSAAALYGSRAGNGVVLITTKSGKKKKGLGISVTSSTVFDIPYKYLPANKSDFASGGRPYTPDNNPSGVLTIDESASGWIGPQLDQGYNAIQWNSPLDANGNPVPIPLVSYPNNEKNFMQTGITSTNTVAVSNANDKMNYRLSFTNMDNRGILPNTDLFKNSINLHTDYRVTDKLSVETNINYVFDKSNNRAARGRGTNPMEHLGYMNPSVNINDLKNYWVPGQEGIQQLSYAPGDQDNPWFLAYQAINNFDRNRIYGNVKGTYQITPHLNIIARFSRDSYDEQRETKIAKSYTRAPNGVYGITKLGRAENNTEVMSTYNNKFNDFDLDVAAGYNYMYQKYTDMSNSTNAAGIIIPQLFNLSNILPTSLNFSNNLFQKAIYSVYGTASLGYKGWLYLNATARNDWASTLPANNRSYFYPSVSLSVLLNQAFNMPDYVSLFKLRGGWAQVGKDTDPYKLFPVANNAGAWGSETRLTLPNNILNANLKPEIATSYEFGTDLAFLDNRIRLEATYYSSDNKNQVLGINTPSSSGYTAQIINAGLVRSRGYELAVGYTPTTKGSEVQVDLNANISNNRTKIIRLTEGLDHFTLWEEAKGGAYTVIGQNIGDIYSRQVASVTDPNSPYYGYPVLNSEGSWETNGSGFKDLVKIGNFNPKFIMGLQASVSYKRFTLSTSFDWRNGGQFISQTYRYKESDLHSWRWTRQFMFNPLDHPGASEDLPQYLKDHASQDIVGLHSVGGPIESMGGFEFTEDGITLHDGVFNPGVIEITDNDGNFIKYQENLGGPGTKMIRYGDNYPWDFASAAMFPSDYLKLREVSLSYSFPNRIAQSIGLQHLGLSIYSRDIILWTKAKIGIDPEKAFQLSGTGFEQGIEFYNNLPWTIPVGIKLSVDF